MVHTCMHGLATHPLTPLPASGQPNRSQRRHGRGGHNSNDSAAASTEASIHRSVLASRPFPAVLLLLSLFLPYVSILSGTSVFLLSPQGSRNKENHYHQSLPGTRCCWRPKWAPRSPHPGKPSNKHTLTRVQQTHAHTHAAPCSRSLSPRKRERQRERAY